MPETTPQLVPLHLLNPLLVAWHSNRPWVLLSKKASASPWLDRLQDPVLLVWSSSALLRSSHLGGASAGLLADRVHLGRLEIMVVDR